MLSHLGLMVLYALLVSLFLAFLWRRGAHPRWRLFLQLFLSMVLGALLLAWLMYPVPSGPPQPFPENGDPVAAPEPAAPTPAPEPAP